MYERWEVLNIVKERVNGDACAHLELAFLAKSVDEDGDLLE